MSSMESGDDTHDVLQGLNDANRSSTTETIGRYYQKGRRSKIPNSTYIPHNRLSRYMTAFSSLAPVKFKSTCGPEMPLDNVGLVVNASFKWLNKYLKDDNNGPMGNHLPSLPHRDSCSVNGPRFESLLQAHFIKRGQSGASIPMVAWQFVRTRLMFGSIIYTLGVLLSLAVPMIIVSEIVRTVGEYNKQIALKEMLQKMNATMNGTGKLNETLTNNLTNPYPIILDEIVMLSHAVLIVVMEISSHFLIAWSASMNLRTASRLRTACLAVAYKKLLRSSIRCTTSAQQTLAYFVPESETLLELITVGPAIITAPLVLIIISLYLWSSLGKLALVGIPVIIVLYCSLILAACFAKSFAARALEYSVKRKSLVEEFVKNIQLAKIALWDQHFQEKINGVRRKELAELQYGAFSEGCGLCMAHVIPIVAISSIVLVLIVVNQEIPFINFFPVFVVFLVNLKSSLRTSWMALSSISRGFAFLNKLKTVLILNETERPTDKPIDKNYAIVIRDGSFTWSKSKFDVENKLNPSSRFYVESQHEKIIHQFDFPILPVTTLFNIDFFVTKGSLVGICGPQNSGKTSFLLSILGHTNRIGGSVAIDGSCAYAPEDAWLMDGTVKENVIFEETFDPGRYYEAINASLLNKEIASLPEMDDTNIAFVNFSMAQKQKIVASRVVYMQRDINLLDRPFNNLDLAERSVAFEKCVMQGLKSKTVIIATDQEEFLKKCDMIYIIRDGRIVDIGNHEELKNRSREYLSNIKCRGSDETQQSIELHQPFLPIAPNVTGNLESSNGSSSSDDCCPSHEEYAILRRLHDDKPIIGSTVYVKYIGGWAISLLIFILSAVYSFLLATAPFAIIYVGQKTYTNIQAVTGILTTIVGLSIVCGAILMLAYNRTIFIAAANLHNQWIDSLCKAQSSLFTSTTAPLLLNICSLNLQEVDFALPRSIITVLMHICISGFSAVILGTYCTSWLLIPIAAFVGASIWYSNFIRRAFLDFYERKANSLIKVLNYVASTTEGRTSIQALTKEKEFAKKFYEFFNDNTAYDFLQYATRLWIRFRIKMMAAATMGVVVLMSECMTVIRTRVETVGLTYICTIQLVVSVVYITESINNVYTSLIALSRIDHYMENLPKEKEGNAYVSIKWPVDTSIIIRDLVLQDSPSNTGSLNFVISPKSKIAIITSQAEVRSNFVAALYRFSDIPKGTITIGGMDTSRIPLINLRQCINFIPGNPKLFNGSIRYNLDPSMLMPDQFLMSVLQKVQLWPKVSKLPDKLVSDSSHLFTACERLLIFLARAVINEKSRIIILEELGDDWKDDEYEIVEIVLRDVFAEHTVIRLSNKMLDCCDKFVTLDYE